MTYEFKTKPFQHQLEEFERSKDLKSRALWWEMGCGKTKPTIDTAAHLYRSGQIRGLLVLAPKAVAPNWARDEVNAHLPDDVRAQSTVVLWDTSKAGTIKYQQELERALKCDGLLIVCMSYDGIMTEVTASQRKVKSKYVRKLRRGHELVRELLTTRPTMMVLDESPRIKDPGSKRTKRVLAEAPRAVYRRALSGTPVANSPFDVYAQVQFLDPFFWAKHGARGWPAFKAKFGVWIKRLQKPDECTHKRYCHNPQCTSTDQAQRSDGTRRCRSCNTTGPDSHPRDEVCTCRTYPFLLGYQNLDALQTAVAQVGSRLLKRNVLDLPEKLYRQATFYLEPAQEELYRQLRSDFMAFLSNGDMITAPLVITQLMRLQQITSGYVRTDDGVLHRPSDTNPRVETLMDLLEDVESKAIVWCKFREDFEQIAPRLRKAKIPFVEYHGATSERDRELNRTAFQTDDNVRVFLGNPSCAGEGLTLHAASTVIYYNTSFKLWERLQSEDRAHRIGQRCNVQYIDLVADNTVDERVLQALRDKKDLADLIMGDPRGNWI